MDGRQSRPPRRGWGSSRRISLALRAQPNRSASPSALVAEFQQLISRSYYRGRPRFSGVALDPSGPSPSRSGVSRPAIQEVRPSARALAVSNRDSLRGWLLLLSRSSCGRIQRAARKTPPSAPRREKHSDGCGQRRGRQGRGLDDVRRLVDRRPDSDGGRGAPEIPRCARRSGRDDAAADGLNEPAGNGHRQVKDDPTFSVENVMAPGRLARYTARRMDGEGDPRRRPRHQRRAVRSEERRGPQRPKRSPDRSRRGCRRSED